MPLGSPLASLGQAPRRAAPGTRRSTLVAVSESNPPAKEGSVPQAPAPDPDWTPWIDHESVRKSDNRDVETKNNPGGR